MEGRGELADCRRFATRDDQSIEAVQLVGASHLAALDSQAVQDAEMLGEVALQS
jgi:hypothetical protein